MNTKDELTKNPNSNAEELLQELCESNSELFNHERVKNVSVRFEC